MTEVFHFRGMWRFKAHQGKLLRQPPRGAGEGAKAG